MSNQLISHWLLAMIDEKSTSNRSPKNLWPIDYSSMTSITHWCNWLLINDPSITHRLLYCAWKKLFLLSCTFFSFVILLSVLDALSLYLKFLLTMSRHKVLITNTNDSQLYNLQNWTTLTGQLSRCGPTKTATERYWRINLSSMESGLPPTLVISQ